MINELTETRLHYDMSTSNKSFLQVAKELRNSGVENWYFMLVVHDESLIDIDPFDTSELTDVQKIKIVRECIWNPWYYLREVCRIPDPSDPNGVPYKATRDNIAQAWCIYHGLDSWLCSSDKQLTESAIAMQTWAYSFGTSYTTFSFLDTTTDRAKINMYQLRGQVDRLPSYLKSKSVITENTMTNALNKNKILIKCKATSSDSAISIARGLSTPIIYFNEPGEIPYIDLIIKHSLPAYQHMIKYSKDNGYIHARIFTCKPGDLDSESGKVVQSIIANTITWDDNFYDKKIKEIEDLYEASESNNIIYIEL